MSMPRRAERADGLVQRPRAVVRLERQRRAPLPVARGRAACTARARRSACTPTWSPTSSAREARPCIRAARALAIAATAGSPSSATAAAASPVVGAATAVRPRHRREEAPALVERDRVRADLADVLERHLRGPDEAVVDRQDRLGDDRQRGVVEQVVRLVPPGRRGSSRWRTPYVDVPDATTSTTSEKEGCGTMRAAGNSRSQAAALCAPSRPG